MARIPRLLRPLLLRGAAGDAGGILPEEAGLIVADAFGAEILREPDAHPLAPARRKAVTLRFAHVAAGLLHALADPGAIREGAL